MPNVIKYSLSAQTEALKKGNFWIGTGDVGKGPTSSSDYWQGITPPTGGYTIYLNKASQGPSIYTPTNDDSLITLTNMVGTQSFTSVTQCFNWYNTQSDKMVFNRDYPEIITSGLVLNLDAGFIPSYSTSGVTWYDISSGGNNGTLINGPIFSSGNGGSIVFDGTNDYVTISDNNVFDFGTGDFAIEVWVYFTTLAGNASTGPTLVVLRNYYTGNSGFAFYITKAGKMSVYTTSFFSEANASVVIDKWQQLIFTRISGVSYLYNNADLRDSRAFTLNVLVNNRIDIGFDTQFSSDPLTGRISSVKIYSGKGLTANEVLQNYNAQKSRFGL